MSEQVLRRMNRVLSRWGAAPMDRPGRLYTDVDENFLTTFPELDHFPGRENAAYWGPVLLRRDGGGAAVPGVVTDLRWPDASGPRVFAYLKPSPAGAGVIDALKRGKYSALVYVEGASRNLRRRLESPTLRVSDAPLDLARVGSECDAAVLHAGHGVTAEMLLAGKPILQIPLALEQRLTADAVARLGAGLKVPAGQPDSVRPALEALLTDSRFTDAARAFADRYAPFDPERQCAAMLARAEELLCESPALV